MIIKELKRWVRSVRARSARISIFSHFNYVTQIRRISLASLIHTAIKITGNLTLEYELDYDENLTRASHSNTGTWKPAVDALKESDFSAYLAPDTDESDNEEESVSRRAQSLL